MANTKTVDKSKKSNIKCEHCKHFQRSKEEMCVTENHLTGTLTFHHPQDKCAVTNETKNYWNRCKNFEWEDKYNNQ